MYAWSCLDAAELAYSQGRFERVLEVTGWIEQVDRAAPMPAFVTPPALAWPLLVHAARGAPPRACAPLSTHPHA